MTWASPEAFLLFIPLIAAAIFYWRVSVRHRARLPFPFDWSQKGSSTRRVMTPFRLQVIMRTLALGLLIFGLARPQQRQEKEKRVVDALDILIVFDLSKSMQALDFSPDRRTVAIETMMRFIQKRPDDRIGLVLFSGEAYLSVPLTLDHDIVLQALRNSSNAGLEDGTAIGQGLAVAVNHLRQSKATSKIVVLVTDGDNNMGSVDPISAADIAAGYKIRVHTIGIGKKGRVPFPVVVEDAFGQRRQVLQYLTDAANDELLQQMSGKTGGKFYSATDQSLLDKIYDDIDQLEKSRVEIFKQVKVLEMADIWIWLGVIILLLEGFALQTLWRKFP